ncbi:MAG TPA: aminotransferase class III-fold pyridoxal phosphate-dependent enzyme [Sphingopyxis sp.]|nr:aminotransferase class III-fold pyridoxal phosphate-dependent enzyme [Sphingopyxis sp.]HMP43834.1 aminotransferase class III-fold pyridoxal phosphate-dependent enzyme [Sphingopyxis sp.]HMQ18878.1 aminotransferase class III-fold pyridoxal phosphate-dependent enzyme [Sphingopyxis sp.]
MKAASSLDQRPAARSPIVAQYLERTAESAAVQARAERSIPGGNSRQAGHWLPHPLTIAHAAGAHLFDVDGHRYIDLTNNFTSLVHGHGYAPITEAVTKQIADGTAWAANNSAQLELAEAIVARLPGMDLVRFANSGTEAANLALIIARTLTGRHKILMARYGYHGSMMEFESGAFDLPYPATLTATYNDLASFEAVLAKHGDEVAAVFLEPAMGAGGVIEADADFLRGVQAAARKAGALFILDEVITLRMSTGGLQAVKGIEPDLTMMGKLIGGGFPVGAVGGKAEFFKPFDPANLKAWHSGTFNANPVTMTAGTVAVRHLTAERIAAMAALAEMLAARLAASAEKYGLPFSVNRCGSMLNIFFSPATPPAALLRADQELIGKFHIAAMNRGVFLAARGMMVLSTIMTGALIDEVADRLDHALADLAVEQ